MFFPLSELHSIIAFYKRKSSETFIIQLLSVEARNVTASAISSIRPIQLQIED